MTEKLYTQQDLDDAVKLAVEAERLRCAALCEYHASFHKPKETAHKAFMHAARAIREDK